MNNAEWMVKNGYDFTKLGVALNGEESFESYSYKIFLDKTHIATITTNDSSCLKAMLLWLNQKHVELILNNAERQYLSAAIKPFRQKVKYISKVCLKNEILIVIDLGDEDIPSFEKGTMYKGMKENKKYTLKELGL